MRKEIEQILHGRITLLHSAVEDGSDLHREGGGFPGHNGKEDQGDAPGAGEQPHSSLWSPSCAYLDVVPCASSEHELLLGGAQSHTEPVKDTQEACPAQPWFHPRAASWLSVQQGFL